MTTSNPSQHPSRRTVLSGGVAVGLGSLALVAVRGVVDSASAAVPTAASNAALATTTGCATLTKEETQGPFWIDEKLNRSDIRYDTGSKSTSTTTPQAGVPLTLTIKLQDAGADCAPQAGAYVDIWHANAQGAYSDVSGSGNPDETGHNFLRGYQVSDDDGLVTFTTVWPGWYSGRTVHIHARVRLALDASTTVNFTTQIFFDESTNNAVLATSAYQKSGTRTTTNANDGIYDASLQIPVTGSTSAGYAGTFTINLDFGDGDTGTGTGGTGTTGTGSTDSTVAASVAGVEVARRRGRRIVTVTLNSQEKVATRLRLLDDDDVLAQKTTGWLAAGRHTVRLKVPGSVPAGRYDVQVGIADKAGNLKTGRHAVRLP